MTFRYPVISNTLIYFISANTCSRMLKKLFLLQSSVFTFYNLEDACILYGRTNFPLCQVKCKSLKFYSKLHNYKHLNNKVIKEKGLIIKEIHVVLRLRKSLHSNCWRTLWGNSTFISILFFIILMVTTY